VGEVGIMRVEDSVLEVEGAPDSGVHLSGRRKEKKKKR
jgi:hypothetical protein